MKSIINSTGFGIVLINTLCFILEFIVCSIIFHCLSIDFNLVSMAKIITMINMIALLIILKKEG